LASTIDAEEWYCPALSMFVNVASVLICEMTWWALCLTGYSSLFLTLGFRIFFSWK
jgi:hypothetical protein